MNHVIHALISADISIFPTEISNGSRTYNHLVRKRTLNQFGQMVHGLNGCTFESRCSNLNFRSRACFEQGVPWHTGIYGVWIQCETRTWHDINIQEISKFCNIKKYRYRLRFDTKYIILLTFFWVFNNCFNKSGWWFQQKWLLYAFFK